MRKGREGREEKRGGEGGKGRREGKGGPLLSEILNTPLPDGGVLLRRYP